MRSKCHEKYSKHRVANRPKPNGFFTSSMFFCQARVIGLLPTPHPTQHYDRVLHYNANKVSSAFYHRHFCFLGVSSPNSYSTCSVSRMKAQISVRLDTPQRRRTFKPISDQMWPTPCRIQLHF